MKHHGFILIILLLTLALIMFITNIVNATGVGVAVSLVFVCASTIMLIVEHNNIRRDKRS